VTDWIAAALARLDSEHVDDAAEAMDQLRAHPDEAHDAVLAALSEHRGSQGDLARLLGEWGRPESVPALVDAAERGLYTLRYSALMALAEHTDPTAGDALDALAGSDDAELARLAQLAVEDRRRRAR
jgi:HEAT repeat protein